MKDAKLFNETSQSIISPTLLLLLSLLSFLLVRRERKVHTFFFLFFSFYLLHPEPICIFTFNAIFIQPQPHHQMAHYKEKLRLPYVMRKYPMDGGEWWWGDNDENHFDTAPEHALTTTTSLAPLNYYDFRLFKKEKRKNKCHYCALTVRHTVKKMTKRASNERCRA